MNSSQKPIILQHSDSVFAVKFSPDGRRIATSSSDKTVVIWNASNGETLHTLCGHTDWVRGVAWDPSGEMLISGSRDGIAHIWRSVGTAQLWRSDNGSLLNSLKGHMFGVFGVSCSPSSKLIATAGYDGTSKIWMATTGKLLQTTERQGYSGILWAVAFSPDGKFIVTGSVDARASIFPVTTNSSQSQPLKPLRTLRGHSDSVNAVAWSPKGDLIATGSNDKTVRLWNAVAGTAIRTLTGHSDGVRGVAWSPTGDFIISGSDDQTAIIWSADSGNKLQTLNHHSESVFAVAWSSRGDRIATASADSTAQIISLSLPTKEEKKAKNATNDCEDLEEAWSDQPHDAISNATVHSSRRPPSRCFKHSKQLPFKDALKKLLQIRDLPKNCPHLTNVIPDDDDIETTLDEVDKRYEEVQRCPNTKKLIQDHGLTNDEVKAIICYTMENPYTVYRWLNAWLMSNRRDPKVVDHVGPFFILLYQGMEKLPRLKVRASRAVLVRDIEALRNTFDDHENRCEKGSSLSFWGVASFSTKDKVAEKFSGKHNEDAIVYTCGDLECVSIRDFSCYPGEDEVLPLPPAIFEVNTATKLGKKLVIGMNQKDHHGIAYTVPKLDNNI